MRRCIPTTEDGKEKKASQRELLERFIELQPNFAKKLFTEFSTDSGEEEGDSVEEQIRTYMEKHKVSYVEAVRALFPDGLPVKEG